MNGKRFATGVITFLMSLAFGLSMRGAKEPASYLALMLVNLRMESLDSRVGVNGDHPRFSCDIETASATYNSVLGSRIDLEQLAHCREHFNIGCAHPTRCLGYSLCSDGAQSSIKRRCTRCQCGSRH